MLIAINFIIFVQLKLVFAFVLNIKHCYLNYQFNKLFMKKLFLSALALGAFSFSSQAQELSTNALGLRLGDNDGFGYEISYQRAFGDTNRLELDLGMRSNNNVEALKLAGVYQWVWNIDGGFNWYAGVGAGLGRWSAPIGSDTFFFAAGDIGVEYNFDFPLQVSLDFRPEFGSDTYYKDNYGTDIALGVRYKF